MVARIVPAVLLSFFMLAAPPLLAEALTDLDTRELADAVAQGVPIIDIRTPQEWRETGVIEGSHLLTFFDEQGRYDLQSWLSELDRIVDADEPFALICRTGRRSGMLGHFLAQQLDRGGVHHAADGMRGWIVGGRPVTAPEGAGLPGVRGSAGDATDARQ